MAARYSGGAGGAGGSGRSYPDAFTVATTKLSQDWSANRCVPHINEDWLNALLDDARSAGMDPPMKVRLLLAGMVALNQQQPNSQSNSSSSDPAREGLQEALARLQATAAKEADEWVKVTAAAAGQLDGRLDLAAVMRQSAVVSLVKGLDVTFWTLFIFLGTLPTAPAAAAAVSDGWQSNRIQLLCLLTDCSRRL
jgi:hypothetical protein